MLRLSSLAPSILALSPSLGLSALPGPALAQRVSNTEREWGHFIERFVLADGRIIDTGNGGISHTEGQGTGMLAAEHASDGVSFDRIWTWTRQTLRRTDGLHSWRYRPDEAMSVDDSNNATDGDLLIALALFRASQRWNNRAYYRAAMETTRSIIAKLIYKTQSGVVLLPGANGFTHPDGVVVNPSYYVFPALRRLAAEMPHPAWRRVWDGGVALMQQARFGSFQLPADWVEIPTAGLPRPAEQWPARFSFDAVRVPLYMVWGGLGPGSAVAQVVDFWRGYGDKDVPAWAGLERDDVAPYVQSSGMVAVRHYVNATRAGRAVVLPSVRLATDYYSGALTLLSRMAAYPVPAA